MNAILFILFSYLLGSIPFSYLSSKLKGKDPRREGTGNVGATNTLVVAGPLAGGLALTGDLFKGFLAVQLARYFGLSDWGIAFCGLAAIAGHDFSIFLKFTGGKGIATTGGVLMALSPLFTLIVILFWIIAMVVVRYFIPSTILVLTFLPLMMWLSSWGFEYVFFACGAWLLAVYVHRADMERFFAGNEITIPENIAKFLKK